MQAGTQQPGDQWKCAFVVEIDVEENRKLVDNIQNTFLIKVLKRTTADEKKGRHTKVGNLFLKIKVFKWW